jgi:DNA-binding beta-propeller fold protein YncE
MAHPSACLMYGLVAATSSQLVVFDTAKKQELARVDLGGKATDIDLSPNGAHLVVVLEGAKQISAIDPRTFTIAVVPTAAFPVSVEVDNGGIVYYAAIGSDGTLHRIRLSDGLAGDVKLTTPFAGYPGLELTADGKNLYDGATETTSSHLFRLDVSGTDAVRADTDNWNGGFGFALPPRYAYLSPGGTHVYYAGYQLDAAQLTFVRGSSGYILAENAAASVAISTVAVLDAQLLTPLATFAAPISAGALTASDQELWTFDANTGVMTCTKLTDFIAGKSLGVRESAARPIGDYTFNKLVADPVRARLYGLDRIRRVVVQIAPETGTAVREVLVGSGPTDLEIDPTGTSLYTGHSDTQGLAQLDAESFTFQRFIPTRYDNYDIAPLGADRIGSIDFWEWTSPSLIDVATGNVLDFLYDTRYEGQLAATADGKTLFVADNPGLTNPVIVRYDVSAGKLQQVTKGGAGLGIPASVRTLLATPDGTSVYYADRCLDGTDLTHVRYAQPDRILSVAPNGALATSVTAVYRVSDGMGVKSLPMACPIQVIARDSTALYCATAAGIISVDLRGLP